MPKAGLTLGSDHADPNRLALAFPAPQPHPLRLFLCLEGLRKRRKLAVDVLEEEPLLGDFRHEKFIARAAVVLGALQRVKRCRVSVVWIFSFERRSARSKSDNLAGCLSRLRVSVWGAPTSAQPERRVLISSFVSLKRPEPSNSLGKWAVKTVQTLRPMIPPFRM